MENQKSKPEQLYPRKLLPPVEAVKIKDEKMRKSLPKNPLFRFIKVFFGEGY